MVNIISFFSNFRSSIFGLLVNYYNNIIEFIKTIMVKDIDIALVITAIGVIFTVLTFFYSVKLFDYIIDFIYKFNLYNYLIFFLTLVVLFLLFIFLDFIFFILGILFIIGLLIVLILYIYFKIFTNKINIDETEFKNITDNITDNINNNKKFLYKFNRKKFIKLYLKNNDNDNNILYYYFLNKTIFIKNSSEYLKYIKLDNYIYHIKLNILYDLYNKLFKLKKEKNIKRIKYKNLINIERVIKKLYSRKVKYDLLIKNKNKQIVYENIFILFENIDLYKDKYYIVSLIQNNKLLYKLKLPFTDLSMIDKDCKNYNFNYEFLNEEKPIYMLELILERISELKLDYILNKSKFENLYSYEDIFTENKDVSIMILREY